MLKRLLPRQDSFFEYFQQAADKLQSATIEFSNLLHNLGNQQQHVDKIAQLEEEANTITAAAFELLHKTFITPFDRHDIHELNSNLDIIINLVNRCSQRFPFYHLTAVPDEIVKLSELSAEAASMVRQAVYALHTLEKTDAIFKSCDNIDLIERKAHKVVLSGEKKLYLEENDFKHFFKLKEIYSRTKLVINRSQHVANILKGIVLEYS